MTKLNNLQKNNQREFRIADKIATSYLKKFPRKQCYGVTVSTEDDASNIFFHELSDEELKILQHCSSIASI